VHDDFAEVAKDSFAMDQIVSRLVSRIPGGFIVHDELDAAFLNGCFHGPGMFHVHRERFFHHDVEAEFGALFHNTPMLEGARENRNRLNVGVSQQQIEAWGRIDWK